MSTTMNAKEIGEAWLTFVTDIFMVEDGFGRPEVGAEFKRLETSGALNQAREEGRTATDALIGEILRSQPDSRRQLLASTDSLSLALVQDRVQFVTQILTGLVQRGVEVNTGGAQQLPEFFRQMLLNKSES